MTCDLDSRPPSLRDTGVLGCALDARIRLGAVDMLSGGRPEDAPAVVRPGDSPSFEGSLVLRACREGGGPSPRRLPASHFGRASPQATIPWLAADYRKRRRGRGQNNGLRL
ncbi:hypothetical protein THAOC_33965 [Thalassiosira oceanica]|uniref:Uncharacterized protein n=1 Tax=Thalassiosira oceanica TaxID=159749 RepID=K0R399_THAOC|nr:hypothetical protein THAOC_33965 [Thalassiosira oceanica]|eukprot:EJK47323.1 hypothetical protein THAOC_33965 [Thalassiosira oceanica]